MEGKMKPSEILPPAAWATHRQPGKWTLNFWYRPFPDVFPSLSGYYFSYCYPFSLMRVQLRLLSLCLWQLWARGEALKAAVLRQPGSLTNLQSLRGWQSCVLPCNSPALTLKARINSRRDIFILQFHSVCLFYLALKEDQFWSNSRFGPWIHFHFLCRTFCIVYTNANTTICDYHMWWTHSFFGKSTTEIKK